MKQKDHGDATNGGSVIDTSPVDMEADSGNWRCYTASASRSLPSWCHAAGRFGVAAALILLSICLKEQAVAETSGPLEHQAIYGYIVDAWTRCAVDGQLIIGEACAAHPETSGDWVTNHGDCVWDGDDLWNDTPPEICLNVDITVHLLSLVVCGRQNDEWSGQISFSNLPYVVPTGERYHYVKNYDCARACAIPIAYSNGQGQAEGYTAIPSDNGNGKFGYGVPTTVRFETFSGAKGRAAIPYSEVIFANTERCGGRGFLEFNHERLAPFTDLYWSNDPQ